MLTTTSLNNNTYLDLVQQATRRNTLQQVAEAQQSGQPLDVDTVKLSNQALRDSARETGVELYSQQLVKQQFETYASASANASDNSQASSNGSSESSSSVWTYDAANVNEALQTAQQRALGVSVYERLYEAGDNVDGFDPVSRPVTRPVFDVYV